MQSSRVNVSLSAFISLNRIFEDQWPRRINLPSLTSILCKLNGEDNSTLGCSFSYSNGINCRQIPSFSSEQYLITWRRNKNRGLYCCVLLELFSRIPPASSFFPVIMSGYSWLHYSGRVIRLILPSSVFILPELLIL